MASTKYRKREKSNDSSIKESEPKSKPRSIEQPILDASRHAVLDSGDKGQEPEAKPIESPQMAENEVAPEARGETLIDKIRIEDARNVFEIRLTKKINRLTRLAFYFNDVEIRPHTYGGANAGSSFFNLLKSTQRKG